MSEMEQGHSGSQDSQIDEVAQAILDQSQDSAPVSAQPKETLSQDVPASGEQFEIKEEDLTEFKGLGYSDEDLTDLTPEEVTAIISTKTQKPTETSELGSELPESPKEIIITPEMAAKHGFAKSLIGKPIDEAFAVIDKQNKQIQKLQIENKTVSTKLTETDKKKADDLFNELQNIDPLDVDKETLAKKLQELKGYAEKGLFAEPKDLSQEEVETYFYNGLQEKLPDLDVREIAVEWSQTLTPELKEAFSKVAPQVIEKAIVDFATLKNARGQAEQASNQAKEVEKDKQRSIAKLAAEKALQALRQSKGKPVNNSKWNVVPRKTEDGLKGMDATARGILEKYAED